MKNCGFPAEQFFIRYIPHGTNVSDLKNEEYSIDNQPETEVSEPTTEKIVATSPIEVFQFYPNVLQALKNQNVSLVKDLLVVPGSRFSCERNIGSSKVKAMRALVNALRPYLQGSDTESIPLEALPIAPTLSPLGKENWEEMCSADQKFVDTEKIDKSDTSTTAVFQKRIDWSLLTAGTTIPVAYYDLFLKNLSYEPQPGEGQAVDVVLEDKRYSARVIKVAFSSGRKPVLQLLWGSKNSGIVKVLQATFAQIYAQLSADRKNKEGLDHIFTFSQGKQLDEFILSLDKPLIEVSETDKKETYVVEPAISGELDQAAIGIMLGKLVNLKADNFKFTGTVDGKEVVAQMEILCKGGKTHTVKFYQATDDNDVGDFIAATTIDNYLYLFHDDTLTEAIKNCSDLAKKN
jgi:hypothetical protein